MDAEQNSIMRKRLDQIRKACRGLGLKATRQRNEILKALVLTNTHPDAETIYANVKLRIPSLSRDTVYRTLRTLEQTRVINRVCSIKHRARYDADTSAHHHFVCIACGRIIDCSAPRRHTRQTPKAIARLGKVLSVASQWHGLCKNCLNDKQTPQPTQKETTQKEPEKTTPLH